MLAAARHPDRTLVDGSHALLTGDRALYQLARARAGDTGEDHEHAQGDVDVDGLQVVGAGPAHLQSTRRLTDPVLERSPVVEVAAGEGVGLAQLLDRKSVV